MEGLPPNTFDPSRYDLLSRRFHFLGLHPPPTRAPGAHAATEAGAIYEILREGRSRAGFPMRSLVGIRQGLQELVTLHSESAVAAFDTIQSAATPLLECFRQILSSDDRYRLEALSGLL